MGNAFSLSDAKAILPGIPWANLPPPTIQVRTHLVNLFGQDRGRGDGMSLPFPSKVDGVPAHAPALSFEGFFDADCTGFSVRLQEFLPDLPMEMVLNGVAGRGRAESNPLFAHLIGGPMLSLPSLTFSAGAMDYDCMALEYPVAPLWVSGFTSLRFDREDVSESERLVIESLRPFVRGLFQWILYRENVKHPGPKGPGF